MNPILDFYGYYGTESALQNERSKFGDLMLRAYRKISDFKFGNYYDKLLSRADDFDQLTTENLKKEDSEFPYDYKFVKGVLETTDKFNEVRDDILKIFESFKEFEEAFKTVVDGSELVDVVDENKYKSIKSFTISSVIGGLGIFLEKIFNKNGFINPLRSNLLNGVYLTGILFLLDGLIRQVMVFKYTSDYNKVAEKGKDLYKEIFNKLDWNRIKKVVSKLHDIPKNEVLKEEDILYAIGDIEKGKYTITYEEKVELIELLKKYWGENKDKIKESRIDNVALHAYGNIIETGRDLIKYNLDTRNNMITTYVEDGDIEKFNILLILNTHLSAQLGFANVLVDISSYLNRL